MKQYVKWIIWGALGLFTVLFIALYLILFPPLPLIPEIARNLPSTFVEGEKEFSDRVKKHFPPSTKESVLIQALQQQGFTVVPDKKLATFSKQKFPCLLEWNIVWKANQGTISEINAFYGASCL